MCVLSKCTVGVPPHWRARISQIIFLLIGREQGEVSSKKKQQGKGLLCRRVAIGLRLDEQALYGVLLVRGDQHLFTFFFLLFQSINIFAREAK